MTNRVEYQKHWALCEILGRHDRQQDYCFVFELHDDVVILDCADAPSSAEFCQVKTRAANRGRWTVSRLVDVDVEESAEGPTGLSILGKLFDNRQRFPDETIALTVVSNAPFHLELREGSDPDLEVIPASALSQDVRSKILDHLRHAFGESVADVDLEVFRFQHCTLSLKDAPRHTMGVLQDFLDRRFPGRPLPVAAIYRTLISEINRRTAREEAPASYRELQRHHAISREEIENHLRAMSRASDPIHDLEDIKRRLDHAGWSWRRVRALQTEWREYMIQRTDPEHTLAQACRDWIAPIVVRTLSDSPDMSPPAIVDAVNTALAATSGRPVGLRPEYCDAVILFEATEYIASTQVPAPDSPTEEEAA